MDLGEQEGKHSFSVLSSYGGIREGMYTFDLREQKGKHFYVGQGFRSLFWRRECVFEAESEFENGGESE